MQTSVNLAKKTITKSLATSLVSVMAMLKYIILKHENFFHQMLTPFHVIELYSSLNGGLVSCEYHLWVSYVITMFVIVLRHFKLSFFKVFWTVRGGVGESAANIWKTIKRSHKQCHKVIDFQFVLCRWHTSPWD